MQLPEIPFADAARELVRVGRSFSARGSAPATSGNFSVRLSRRRIAITRSGLDKGDITEADILAADIDVPPPQGSSAETPLHFGVYRNLLECGAVVHTHANAAAVLSMVDADKGEVILTGWELLKAFRGIRTHEAQISVPIFQNDQDIFALSVRISSKLQGRWPIAYLLAGHGLYTWGYDLNEAQRHAVALEHLLTCELERRKVR